MATKRKLPMKSIHPAKKAFWLNGLYETLKDKTYVVKEDENVTVIRDKFPKARFHYLIIPKKNIKDLKELRKDHIGLLQHMEDIALHLIEKEESHGCNFNIGFHAKPSMPPLHLHVISDDMNSVYLKTKKHWNSFTTDFFLDFKSVLSDLQENGLVTIPSVEMINKLMNTPLRCHKCKQSQPNMPALKLHIVSHLENTPK